MTATESLFFGTINDFCNKIGTQVPMRVKTNEGRLLETGRRCV
jgi:hypothetical protein